MEKRALLTAEFDVTITGLVAQPFKIIDVDYHVPDLLVRHDDGSLTVIDITATSMLRQPHRSNQYTETSRWCREHGFHYSVIALEEKQNRLLDLLLSSLPQEEVSESERGRISDLLPMDLDCLWEHLCHLAPRLELRPVLAEMIYRGELRLEGSLEVGVDVVPAGVGDGCPETDVRHPAHTWHPGRGRIETSAPTLPELLFTTDSDLERAQLQRELLCMAHSGYRNCDERNAQPDEPPAWRDLAGDDRRAAYATLSFFWPLMFGTSNTPETLEKKHRKVETEGIRALLPARRSTSPARLRYPAFTKAVRRQLEGDHTRVTKRVLIREASKDCVPGEVPSESVAYEIVGDVQSVYGAGGRPGRSRQTSSKHPGVRPAYRFGEYIEVDRSPSDHNTTFSSESERGWRGHDLILTDRATDLSVGFASMPLPFVQEDVIAVLCGLATADGLGSADHDLPWIEDIAPNRPFIPVLQPTAIPLVVVLLDDESTCRARAFPAVRPSTITLDAGSVEVAGVRQFAAATAVHVSRARPGQGSDKSTVENQFNDLSMRLGSLPGYVGRNSIERAREVATINFLRLRAAKITALVNRNRERTGTSQGLMGQERTKARATAARVSRAVYGNPQLRLSPAQRFQMLRSKRAAVVRNSVNLGGLTYVFDDPHIGTELTQRGRGRHAVTYPVKYSHIDRRKIFLEHPTEGFVPMSWQYAQHFNRTPLSQQLWSTMRRLVREDNNRSSQIQDELGRRADEIGRAGGGNAALLLALAKNPDSLSIDELTKIETNWRLQTDQLAAMAAPNRPTSTPAPIAVKSTDPEVLRRRYG